MKKYISLLLTITLTCSMLFSYNCYADQTDDTIRVCYYPLENTSGSAKEHPYGGYYFDYLQEMSQYTGWTYEYIDATYEEALSMLANDELDLICGITKNASHSNLLSYSSMSVISAKYKFFADINNDNLFYDDYLYFNNKKVGVLSNCCQTDAIDALCDNYGITLNLLVYDTLEEMETALLTGEIDMLYATNVTDNSRHKIVAHFPNTPLYFATAKDDPLMADINAAQKNLSNLFSFFEYDLFVKNVASNQDFSPYFTKEELAFIKESPVIYYSADPDWAPIEYHDAATGELKGVTSEILKLIEEYSGLTFTYKPADTFTEALDKLKYGEVTILTALSHDYEWASENNVNLSTAYLDTYIVMVYSPNNTAPEDSVALPRNFNVTEQIVASNRFKDITYYDTVQECIQAVADGTVSCTFTNNYIANYHLSNLAYRNLSATKLSDISENLSIAVSKNADLRLLSIIDKCLRCISSEDINAIVLEHTLYESELTFRTLVYAYPEFVLLLVFAFFTVVFLILLTILIVHRRKARTIERISQTDALTGILNRGAVQAKITMALEKEKRHPELVCPLIAIDLDNFKSINDTYGHMEGDRLLIAVAEVLKNSVRKTDIVGRLGGDEFIVYLTNVSNKKTAEKVAAKLCTAVSALSLEKNEWSEITGSFGLAFGNPDINWNTLYRHADSALYVAKEQGKNQYSIYEEKE